MFTHILPGTFTHIKIQQGFQKTRTLLPISLINRALKIFTYPTFINISFTVSNFWLLYKLDLILKRINRL